MNSIIRSIGAFDKALSEYHSDYDVYFDDGRPAGRIISWRGVYAQASLDHGRGASLAGLGYVATVGALKQQIKDLYGGVALQGYKGSEFLMREHSAIWADEYGECTSIAILSVTFDYENARVVVNRIRLDDD